MDIVKEDQVANYPGQHHYKRRQTWNKPDTNLVIIFSIRAITLSVIGMSVFEIKSNKQHRVL